MSILSVCLVLATAPAAPSACPLPAAPAPSVSALDAVEDWLAELDRLLETNAQEQVIQHLRGARDLADPRIVRAVDDLLDSDERAPMVEVHALDTLGFIAHEDALQRLHHRARRDRRIGDDDDLSSMLYKAIGRHRNTSSIDLLIDDLVVASRPKTTKAKIFGLGRIRAPETVEAMIREMNKLPTPEKGKSGIIPHGRDFRSALYALTGEDLGENRDPWQRWWNENKRDLQIAAQEPDLTGEAGERWARYWRVGQGQGQLR